MVGARSSSAYALTLNYASHEDAVIKFTGTGNTFQFVPDAASGFDFQIGSVDDSSDPNTVGLHGNISGTFTIGAISTSGPVQTAPVTGAGTVSILDEASVLFSADLAWD
jgi:hypothetical protein